jgi:formylglycine-generating enzyme required for sulfatase activity
MKDAFKAALAIACLAGMVYIHQASAEELTATAEQKANTPYKAPDATVSSSEPGKALVVDKPATAEKPPAVKPEPVAPVADKAPVVKKASVAQKTTRERLVQMPLRVPDEDAALIGAMETALVQGLKEKYEVFSGEQVSQKAREIFLKESRATSSTHKNCDETRCMQDIAEAFQAELISTANVSRRADGYLLAISIQNIFDNKVIFSNSIPCKNCDIYQVIDRLKELSGAVKAAKQEENTFRDCPGCPEMVIIPTGGFDMGGTEKSNTPVHLVSISRRFAIGKTEVTQGQWKAIMGTNPSEFPECGERCPVEKVSWLDVQEFLTKLNAKTRKQYRLPTEAEWEYACRGGVQNKYCGGDVADEIGWFGPKPVAEESGGWFSSKKPQVVSTNPEIAGNSKNITHPVSIKQPNGYGLYDMSGNVWEWVQDGGSSDYIGAPVDGSAWKGDASKHMLRGGSWYHEEYFMHTETRGIFKSESKNGSFGFRLAVTK